MHLENNLYIIYHEPTKRSFHQKAVQFKLPSLQEYELLIRHLSCQDVIFHRITGVTYSNRQRQSPIYIDQQMNKKKFVTMIRPSGRDDYVTERQDGDLLVKMATEDTELRQRQDLNDYKLIQEKYLRNLEMTDKIKQTYSPEKLGNQDNRQMGQILRETKTDKMYKLR